MCVVILTMILSTTFEMSVPISFLNHSLPRSTPFDFLSILFLESFFVILPTFLINFFLVFSDILPTLFLMGLIVSFVILQMFFSMCLMILFLLRPDLFLMGCTVLFFGHGKFLPVLFSVSFPLLCQFLSIRFSVPGFFSLSPSASSVLGFHHLFQFFLHFFQFWFFLNGGGVAGLLNSCLQWSQQKAKPRMNQSHVS